MVLLNNGEEVFLLHPEEEGIHEMNKVKNQPS